MTNAIMPYGDQFQKGHVSLLERFKFEQGQSRPWQPLFMLIKVYSDVTSSLNSTWIKAGDPCH